MSHKPTSLLPLSVHLHVRRVNARLSKKPKNAPMITSALITGVCGILLQFFPHEILNYFGISSSGVTSLFLQVTGALYLGFAMMNWMAKAVLIGGIYARPLAIGNFVHFIVGALAFLKYAFANNSSLAIWITTLIYFLFSILFGYVFFTHPLKAKHNAEYKQTL